MIMKSLAVCRLVDCSLSEIQVLEVIHFLRVFATGTDFLNISGAYESEHAHD